jgi:hypothetical protein
MQRKEEKIGVNDIRATPQQSPTEGSSDERRSGGKMKIIRKNRPSAHMKIK